MKKRKLTKKEENILYSSIEKIVGMERIDMIGENEWDRIDDEIVRLKIIKKITKKQADKVRKALIKLKDI